MEALGIEYLVEDGQVISKIDYDKFENFMFWALTKLIKKPFKKADRLWPAFYFFNLHRPVATSSY